jgi:hypothetical protein
MTTAVYVETHSPAHRQVRTEDFSSPVSIPVLQAISRLLGRGSVVSALGPRVIRPTVSISRQPNCLRRVVPHVIGWYSGRAADWYSGRLAVSFFQASLRGSC